MTIKTKALHCATIQPISSPYYDGDNEYIHNIAVDSQQLWARLKKDNIKRQYE